MSCGKCAMLRLWVAALVGAANVSCAAEYFVSTTGSNGNSGLSGSPWATLQYAADQVGPGDRVTVLPGNYQGFQLTTDGTSNSRIEFFAQPGVFINNENPETPDGINLEGASYITIDGFNVAGMERAGVRSVGFEDDFAEQVTIRNVTASNNGVWGIFTGHVDDLLIENNHTSGSIDEHGIYVSNSGDRPIIRNNESWNNRGAGIHMNGDESLGGDGIISDALVSGNIIYNNGLGGGSGINMDGVQDSRIENNLLYNNHASGISLYQIDGGGGASGNVVVNNTVHQASNGRWALNIQDESINNTVLNNILISDHSFRGAIDISDEGLSGFTSDYNIVIDRFNVTIDPDTGDEISFDLDSWQDYTGQEAHSIAIDPADYDELFVDLAVEDYQLSPTSLARDSGTSQEAPLVDLLGQLRDSLIDRGAYEIVTALAGDFDSDGDVDGRDFLAWQRGGSPNPLSASDLGDWQANYGGGLNPLVAESPWRPSSRAVPEPSGLVLAVLGITICRRRIIAIAHR